VKDATEFKSRWEDSKQNSAVSWWYVGETSGFYYLTEKWKFNHYSYEVPKTMINLVDVEAFDPCKSCKGTNLKSENIKYINSDL
jgi:hypothetical protein